MAEKGDFYRVHVAGGSGGSGSSSGGGGGGDGGFYSSSGAGGGGSSGEPFIRIITNPDQEPNTASVIDSLTGEELARLVGLANATTERPGDRFTYPPECERHGQMHYDDVRDKWRCSGMPGFPCWTELSDETFSGLEFKEGVIIVRLSDRDHRWLLSQRSFLGDAQARC